MVRVESSVPARLPAEVSVGRRFTVTLKVVVFDPELSVALTSILEIAAPTLVGVPTVIFKLSPAPFATRPELGMVLVSDEVATIVTAPVAPVMESGISKLEPTSMILSVMGAIDGAAIEWLLSIAIRKAELRKVVPRERILAALLISDLACDRSSEWIMDACRVMRECRTWLEIYLESEVEEETRTPGTVGGGVSVVGTDAGFGDEGISMLARAG